MVIGSFGEGIRWVALGCCRERRKHLAPLKKSETYLKRLDLLQVGKRGSEEGILEPVGQSPKITRRIYVKDVERMQEALLPDESN